MHRRVTWILCLTRNECGVEHFPLRRLWSLATAKFPTDLVARRHTASVVEISSQLRGCPSAPST